MWSCYPYLSVAKIGKYMQIWLMWVILFIKINTRNAKYVRSKAPILDSEQLFINNRNFMKGKIAHPLVGLKPTTLDYMPNAPYDELWECDTFQFILFTLKIDQCQIRFFVEISTSHTLDPAMS